MNSLKLSDNAILRSAKPSDLAELLEVCLRTSDSGQDGSNIYNLKDLVGDIYAAPYLLHEPNFAYILEIDKKVVGYVLGALDTHKFESKLSAEYWPIVKKKYKNLQSSISKSDELLLKHLFELDFTKEDIVKLYPSHLHIDIIESGQGLGYGKVMIKYIMEMLRGAGSSGVHLHVSAKNFRAQHVYKNMGFTNYQISENEIIMGLNF